MKFRLIVPVLLIALAGCSPQFIKRKVTAQRKAPHAFPTRLEWRSQPDVPQAGLPAIWSLKVLDLTSDKSDPKGVRAYESPHGVALHLFIVSRDLSRYAHLYPEPRDYGNFLVRPVIPEAGAYQLFVDYLPIGFVSSAPGFPTVKSQRFLVQGEKWAPKAPALVPDTSQAGWIARRVQSRVEQEWAPATDAPTYEVQLQATNWQAGRQQTVRAHVLDAAKAPVSDLGLHLGGVAYGVAISQDCEQFVRLEAAKGQTPGEFVFKGTFPVAGIYKIWLEFNHRHQVIVAPFVVRVESKQSH